MQKYPKEWVTQLQLLLHVRTRFLCIVTSNQSELNFLCYPMSPDLSLSQSVRSFSVVLQIRFIRMTNRALAPSTGTAQLLSNQRRRDRCSSPSAPSRNAHPLAQCEKGSHRWENFPADSKAWGKKVCVLARSMINSNP